MAAKDDNLENEIGGVIRVGHDLGFSWNSSRKDFVTLH